MNQNNNEYEIADVNPPSYPSNRINNYSRYPFANDPNQLLQQTNYKDWLNICQGNNQNSGNLITDAGAAVSAGIIVTGTMIAAFAALAVAPFPIVGAIVGGIVIAFGTLLPLVWPGGKEDRTVWTQFFALGETLLGKRLTDDAQKTAAETVDGFGRVLDNYKVALNSWMDLKKKQSPGSPPTTELKEAADNVKQRFEIVHNEFDANMPHLGNPKSNYKEVLLSSYAHAANLHLNLLQQGVRFADQWNQDIYSSQIVPAAGTSTEYLKFLQARIQEYVNYCTATYRSGLNILKNSNDITWDIYNTYRRDMTLTVLDLVAAFPNYDPTYYPIDTKIQLTRTIYSNLLGITQSGRQYFEALENALTMRPNLYRILRGFNFNTTFGSGVNYLSGIANRRGLIKTVPSEEDEQPFYGQSNGRHDPMIFANGLNIFRVTLLRNKHYIALPVGPPLFAANQITDLKLYYGNATQYHHYQPSNEGLTTENTDLSFPPKNEEYLNAILMTSPRTIYENPTNIYSFAWTKKDIDQQNNIIINAITQIPAVKGIALGNQSRVIQGPGHTSGDLVYLKDSLELRCQYTGPQQSYDVRIRYASNGILNDRAMIAITIPGVTGQSISLSETFSGTDYNVLEFQNFKSVQFTSAIRLNPSQNIFIYLNRLDQNANTTLLIDKIEFIPHPLPRILSEQKLKKVKQKVNDLFIDAENGCFCPSHEKDLR